jgi:hypothetical protein
MDENLFFVFKRSAFFRIKTLFFALFALFRSFNLSRSPAQTLMTPMRDFDGMVRSI